MRHWLVAGLVCLPFTMSAVAGEKHRQLGAHEHGHGNFNIAIEGKRVSMELEAPGADIVGFEHKAETKEQKAAVSSAEEKLKDIANVVELPAAAGCKLEKTSVELKVDAGDHDGHKHEKEAAEKGHDHGHGHGHGDKDDKHEAKEASHSEFHAEYALTCASPGKLVELSFPYFNNFKGAEKLEVSVVGPKSQKRFEVERDTGKINLGGII
jgi:hypothetical protein